MNIEKEFELLSEYMSIYIQFISLKIHKRYIPTFEEFKSNYSFYCNPNYVDAIHISDQKLCKHHTVGPGVIAYQSNVATRKFNFVAFGEKIFAPNNLIGSYTIDSSKMNIALRRL